MGACRCLSGSRCSGAAVPHLLIHGGAGAMSRFKQSRSTLHLGETTSLGAMSLVHLTTAESRGTESQCQALACCSEPGGSVDLGHILAE